MIDETRFFVEGHLREDPHAYAELLQRNTYDGRTVDNADFQWVVEQVTNLARTLSQRVHGILVEPSHDTAATFTLLTQGRPQEQTYLEGLRLTEELFETHAWEGIFIVARDPHQGGVIPSARLRFPGLETIAPHFPAAGLKSV